MEYGWIYILILVGLVFWLANNYFIKKDRYLESFRPIVDQILKQSGFRLVSYDLRSSKFKTFTKNKKTIYLVSSKQENKRFNADTILFVLLHEIAHILSSEHHHTENFYQIEKKLHQTAFSLGYLDFNQLDHTYPCFG